MADGPSLPYSPRSVQRTLWQQVGAQTGRSRARGRTRNEATPTGVRERPQRRGARRWTQDSSGNPAVFSRAYPVWQSAHAQMASTPSCGMQQPPSITFPASIFSRSSGEGSGCNPNNSFAIRFDPHVLHRRGFLFTTYVGRSSHTVQTSWEYPGIAAHPALRIIGNQLGRVYTASQDTRGPTPPDAPHRTTRGLHVATRRPVGRPFLRRQRHQRRRRSRALRPTSIPPSSGASPMPGFAKNVLHFFVAYTTIASPTVLHVNNPGKSP